MVGGDHSFFVVNLWYVRFYFFYPTAYGKKIKSKQKPAFYFGGNGGIQPTPTSGKPSADLTDKAVCAEPCGLSISTLNNKKPTEKDGFLFGGACET